MRQLDISALCRWILMGSECVFERESGCSLALRYSPWQAYKENYRSTTEQEPFTQKAMVMARFLTRIAASSFGPREKSCSSIYTLIMRCYWHLSVLAIIRNSNYFRSCQFDSRTIVLSRGKNGTILVDS